MFVVNFPFIMENAMLFTEYLQLPDDVLDIHAVSCNLCARCSTPENKIVEDHQRLGKDHVCSNCYYDEWGKRLDKQPIGFQGIRGHSLK